MQHIILDKGFLVFYRHINDIRGGAGGEQGLYLGGIVRPVAVGDVGKLHIDPGLIGEVLENVLHDVVSVRILHIGVAVVADRNGIAAGAGASLRAFRGAGTVPAGSGGGTFPAGGAAGRRGQQHRCRKQNASDFFHGFHNHTPFVISIIMIALGRWPAA